MSRPCCAQVHRGRRHAAREAVHGPGAMTMLPSWSHGPCDRQRATADAANGSRVPSTIRAVDRGLRETAERDQLRDRSEAS